MNILLSNFFLISFKLILLPFAIIYGIINSKKFHYWFDWTGDLEEALDNLFGV